MSQLPESAPLSFGIGEHLADGAKIYYDSLFSTEYVGRVSDLLSAQIRRGGLDELRLRALLLFAVFEAYQSETAGGAALAKPLVLECGVDHEKIAVGISFNRPPAKVDAGLAGRISSGAPGDGFERLLCELYSHSDKLVLKFGRDSGRLEVIALLSFFGAGTGVPVQKSSPELIEVASAAVHADRGAYVQLADLDYAALLRNGQTIGPKTEMPLGTLIARIAKGESQPEGEIRIAGGEVSPADEPIVIAGVHQDQLDQQKIVIASEANATEQSAQKGGDAEAPPADSQGLGSILKKAWPFKGLKAFKRVKAERPDHQGADTPGEIDVKAAEKDSAHGVRDMRDMRDMDDTKITVPGAGETGGEVEESPSEAAGKLVQEIQSGGFNRVVCRAHQEASEIRGELQSQRAQVWMDGMMGELVAEKARLHELAKNVNLSVRQKEHQFKTKEHALQEELRRKDEALRQREASIVRLKDQISEINMTLERTKSGAGRSGDTSHYKHKYTLAQRMLVSTKEENVTLKNKVEDLRSQLLAAQSASKTSGASQMEVSSLRVKAERAQRQVDELRRTNRQLTDKLSETKRDRTISGGNVEDLKRRLDAAAKLAATQAKESDQLRLQIEELKREEGRLKMELARVLSVVKAGGNKPSGGSQAA